MPASGRRTKKAKSIKCDKPGECPAKYSFKTGAMAIFVKDSGAGGAFAGCGIKNAF